LTPSLCPRCGRYDSHSLSCALRDLPEGGHSGSASGASSAPTIPGTSAARSYDGPPRLKSRRPVGRKAKHASPKIAQREAARAYRARQRQQSHS
jgi:hypothetical protein